MFGKRKFVSRELLEKKRKRRLRLSIFYFSCFLILLAIVIFLPRIKYFSIKDVVVSGAVVENTDVLSAFVKEKISGNYFFVISKNNSILYPRKKTEIAILNNFKRLNKAELSFEGNHTLLLEISERKPDRMWCKEERCYFLDNDGLIFDEAPNFSGNVYFKIMGGVDVAEGENPIGKYFKPVGWNQEEMRSFIVALQDFGIHAESLLVTDDGDIEIKIVDNGNLKISKDKNLNNVYNDLKSAVEAGEVDFSKKYEYIDLRFQNKIFYNLE